MKNQMVQMLSIALLLSASTLFAQSGRAVESHKLPQRNLVNLETALQRQLPSRNLVLPSLVAERLRPLTAAEMTPKPGKLATAAGLHRKLDPDAMERRGRWDPTASGVHVWRMQVEAPGAIGLRIHLRNFDAGPTGRLFVHDGEAGEIHGPYLGRGAFSDGDLWTDVVMGNRIVLEFETSSAPAGPLEAPPFTIAEISHLMPGVLTASRQNEAAAVCHLDVSCFDEWAETAKSVGQIVYEEGGSTYVCSGTLLATRNRSGIPYFLTADHCVDNEAVARTMQVFWLYQTSSCNGTPADRRNIPRSNGARFLVSAGLSRGDFALVQLLSVPDSVTFSGWDMAEIPIGTQVTGIHHPTGDYKRISFGERVSQQTVGFPGANMATFYNIDFSRGSTEGGSSGSGIFVRPGVLAGTLTWGPKVDGANAICRYQPLPTGYGRFSSHYTSIRDYLEDRTAGTPQPTTPPPPTTEQQGTELLPGQPGNVSLESVSSATLFTGQRGFFVSVPQGATRVEIALRVNGEVGLIVRGDQYPTIVDSKIVADYTSSGYTGQENVVMTAQSTPPLRAGAVYYIALANFAVNKAVSGTLQVTITNSTPPPPTGGNTRVLASGVPATFTVNAVQSATLINGNAGFQVQVPQGATRLELRLKTNTASVDLDLFSRFGQDVAIAASRPVADHSAEGATGDEVITITPQSSPALRAGTYYIAFGVFTNNVVINATITATITGGATTTPPPPSTGSSTLISGTPRSFSLSPVIAPTLVNGTNGYVIQVPQGAQRLDIRLSTTTANADLDLLVRYGADPAVTTGKLDADYNSSGPDGNELISITPQSNPPLRAGTYFIALAVFTKNVQISGSITASVTTSAAAPPSGGVGAGNLITPGNPMPFLLNAVASATLISGAQGYRVVVPAGSTRLELRLSTNQPGVDLDLFVRKDVEPTIQTGKVTADYSSTGPTGAESIVIDLTSRPALSAGTYFIALGVFTSGQAISGTLHATLSGAGTTPPATGANNALRSGVAANFSLPSVSAATLINGARGFYIDVPAGAERLDVRLNTATAGADIDLYVRHNADVAVANGAVVADFEADGPTGIESIRIDATTNPPLLAGRYYIGLGVFSTGVATAGTVTATITQPAPAQPNATRDLQAGIPAKVSLPARPNPVLYTGTYGFRLNVPQGVTRVRLELRTETPKADVDLYVRYGEDVDLVAGEGVVSDYSSEGDTGRETIVIGASSQPALRPGIYYIAFGNFAIDTAVESTITASFERESLAPPLSSARQLQTGESARFNLPAITNNGALFQGDNAFRIVVPGGTARLVIDLRADNEADDVDLLVRLGQEAEIQEGRLIADYGSTGDTGVEQVVVDNPAAGVYFINLALFAPGRPVSGTLVANLFGAQSTLEKESAEPLSFETSQTIRAKQPVTSILELAKKKLLH